MKTSTDSITLTIIDIEDSISAAIIAACEESDTLASGVIGPSFACSGPGSGWQKNFGENDYAERSLSHEYGAVGYVDADDGRLATLSDDDEIEWSEESVVELTAPDADDIDRWPETVALMIEALDSGHCIEGSGDWDQARALAKVSEAEALDRWDMEIVDGSVIYYDDATGRWYRNDCTDLVGLRELMGSTDEDVANDAYSHWCAGYSHEGEYETRDEAVAAAEEEENA